MKDFTISIYRELLQNFKQAGYAFHTFQDYMENGGFVNAKAIILRHDVDDRKLHSLLFAEIQHEMGIMGTFYFRMVPESFDEKVIQRIHALGHEIGYHYEDMDFASGDVDEAFDLCKTHLEKLRALVPIKTLCMHGSPRSAYDNKDVWNKYDYRHLGLNGEPYFDLDFDQVFYITDTGRMWDGFKVSVRDKVKTTYQWPVYHHTEEIIKGIQENSFPNHCMMNFHPQRWTDDAFLWRKEWLVQSAKNAVKRWIVMRNSP